MAFRDWIHNLGYGNGMCVRVVVIVILLAVVIMTISKSKCEKVSEKSVTKGGEESVEGDSRPTHP